MPELPERVSILEERARRLESDAHSEKATRSRSNERIHDDIARQSKELEKEIARTRELVDERVGDLKVLMDAKLEKVRSERTSWFERIFWIFAGAVVSAVVSITISRMGE